MTITGINHTFPPIGPRGIEGPAAPTQVQRAAGPAPQAEGLQQVLTAEERAFFLGAGPALGPAVYDATGQAGQNAPVAGLRLDVRA